MKRTEFNAIKNTVKTADENHDVWWCGYYFLEMTEKQLDEIVEILLARGIFPVITRHTPDHQGYHTGILLPSGIEIFEREDY